MDDVTKILAENDDLLTDEDLLKYLHEDISEEEKAVVEKKITGDFEHDAVEGLQQIKDKKSLQSHIKQLNRKLPQLLLKKHRLEKRKMNEMQWIILTIIMLLFFCIVTYILIKMHI